MTTIMITREKKELLAKKTRIIKKKNKKHTPFPTPELKVFPPHPQTQQKSYCVLFNFQDEKKKLNPQRDALQTSHTVVSKVSKGAPPKNCCYYYFFDKEKVFQLKSDFSSETAGEAGSRVGDGDFFRQEETVLEGSMAEAIRLLELGDGGRMCVARQRGATGKLWQVLVNLPPTMNHKFGGGEKWYSFSPCSSIWWAIKCPKITFSQFCPKSAVFCFLFNMESTDPAPLKKIQHTHREKKKTQNRDAEFLNLRASVAVQSKRWPGAWVSQRALRKGVSGSCSSKWSGSWPLCTAGCLPIHFIGGTCNTKQGVSCLKQGCRIIAYPQWESISSISPGSFYFHFTNSFLIKQFIVYFFNIKSKSTKHSMTVFLNAKFQTAVTLSNTYADRTFWSQTYWENTSRNIIQGCNAFKPTSKVVLKFPYILF